MKNVVKERLTLRFTNIQIFFPLVHAGEAADRRLSMYYIFFFIDNFKS